MSVEKLEKMLVAFRIHIDSKTNKEYVRRVIAAYRERGWMK
jgi:hypothetical protein